KREILSLENVNEVSYQRGIVNSLNENIKKISIVIAVFVALLMFISIVLIGNTVRLNVYAHRFSIHTMKLVGATKRFIRRPFIVQAVIQGLIASLLAIAMLLGLMYYLRSEIIQLFKVFPLELLLEVIAIVVATGVLLCTLTSARIVNKLTKLKKEELYY
ncbi:MAG: FtsX-like permease family protein, partial [Bacteroidales bacterium]|nr:FtsX-like permease family protein [Bacteroidales bacterium]